jgi:2-iminobutanoate/2-iminopropanoate deaminase
VVSLRPVLGAQFSVRIFYVVSLRARSLAGELTTEKDNRERQPRTTTENDNRERILMREVISTKDAPQAIGPYSQAIKANGFVFVSGQVAIDPATQQVITGDVAAQTDRVLRNVSEILEAAGSGLGKVVRSTVFLKNMSDFGAMNAVYGKYFSTAPPARSTVEVARLPKDVLVEIDVIALA